MDSQAKVFVTGATGFIGNRLVQELVNRGNSVRALSRRDHPKPPPGIEGKKDPLHHEQVEWVRGDITDPASLLRAMEGCSHVFHLAAYAKNWSADPTTYYRLNVEGMQNVFDAARAHGVQRVVWTSTFVTLGPTPSGVVGDESMPRITDRYFTEYERTKSIAEKKALQQAEEGFPVVVVNPCRVYGPGYLTEGNALSHLIDQYDRGKAPVLLNRGVNIGNYVLVDDVVQGHLLAMDKGHLGERYILGGENASLRTLFETVDRVSEKRHWKIPLLGIGPMAYAYFQKKRAEWFNIYPVITPGWIRTFMADWAYSTQKAEQELGYQPTSLEQGIHKTYQWLMEIREQAR